MTICYYIPIKDELEYIKKSIPNILENMKDTDEILVSVDSVKTPQVIHDYLNKLNINKVVFEWVDDFSELKNLAFSHTSKDWIFLLDADENISPTFINDLNNFLEELQEQHWEGVLVPRINTYTDLEDYPTYIEDNYLQHSVNKEGWFFWPEYQLRIYRNLDHIRYLGKIHESLEGLTKVMTLEPSKTYAIIHEKTIAKQLKSDKYYENFDEHRRLHSENIRQRKTIVDAHKKIIAEVNEVNSKYSNVMEDI